MRLLIDGNNVLDVLQKISLIFHFEDLKESDGPLGTIPVNIYSRYISFSFSLSSSVTPRAFARNPSKLP